VHRIAHTLLLIFALAMVMPVLLLGCRTEPQANQPDATRTAVAVSYECDQLVAGLNVDVGPWFGFDEKCTTWTSDPLGCSDELAAFWYEPGSLACGAGDTDGCPITDQIGGFASLNMEVIRYIQELGCAGAGSGFDTAVRRAAEYFLLGQPNVPEVLKRQLLPATEKWIAASESETRSEALDEMAMQASLYRATNTQPIIFVVPAAPSISAAPSLAPSALNDLTSRRLESQVRDLQSDVDRLNDQLNR